MAVKILMATKMSTSEFLNEANVMKSCRHENLVQLIAVCTNMVSGIYSSASIYSSSFVWYSSLVFRMKLRLARMVAINRTW